jgi:hypothetical protein
VRAVVNYGYNECKSSNIKLAKSTQLTHIHSKDPYLSKHKAAIIH